MKTLNLYRLAVFFVAFAGVLAIAPGEGSLGWPLIFLGVSGVLWWARTRSRVLPPRDRRSAAVINLFLVLSLGASLMAGPDLVMGVLHFSILLQAFRFFTAQAGRHYLQVMLVALSQVLVATMAPVTGLFMLVLLYFVVVSVFALMLLHLVDGYRARRRQGGGGKPASLDPGERFVAMRTGSNRLFLFAFAWSAALLLPATALFLVLPRPDPHAGPSPGNRANRDQRPRRQPQRQREIEENLARLVDLDPSAFTGPGGMENAPVHSGFSGSIDLGRWGVQFDSPREVLAVYPTRAGGFQDPLPRGDFYLRGVILDRFDGMRWTGDESGTYRIVADGDDGETDGRISFQAFQLGARDVWRLNVLARREFGAVRFHGTRLVGAQMAVAYLDRNGALFARPGGMAPEEIEDYVVYHRPLEPDGPVRRSLFDSLSTPPYPALLEVPPGHEAVAALAARNTSAAAKPWIRAQTLRIFLKRYCRYSKEPYTPRPETLPLVEFLFERRAGHCELFASALAVMLRAQGIAARVVGGFHGGTLRRDDFDERYVAVRESDAHAWVEAWFDSAGWVILDATPSGESDLADDAWLPRRRARTFRPNLFQRMMTYDNRSRADLFGGFARSGRGAIRSLASRRPGFLSLPVVAAILFALSAVFLFMGLRQKRRRTAAALLGRSVKASDVGGLGFYVEFLKLLRRLGHVRRASQTPLEFARSVTDADPSLEEVWPVTHHFHRVRYRGDAVSPEDTGELRRALQGLRKKAHR